MCNLCICLNLYYISANYSIPSFTAYQVSDVYFSGEVVPFRFPVFNEGQHYDPLTGLFTCPVRGIYVFHFAVLCDNSSPYWRVNLVKADQVVSSSIGEEFSQMSNLAVVDCDVDEQVWVEAFGDGSTFGDEERRYSSFSGALMREL